jgi:hypothetical protein
MGAQQPLDFTPEPVRVASPDRRLPKELRERGKSQCARILARLEQGPATAQELTEISSHRFGARVFDLNAKLRHEGREIRCEEDVATGASVYRLVAHR